MTRQTVVTEQYVTVEPRRVDAGSSVYKVFKLQRLIGNRALAKWIQRQTLEEITTAPDSMTGNGDLGTIEVVTRPLVLDQGGGEIHLGGSVGHGAQNDPDDVSAVSSRLLELGFDPGSSSDDLVAAIKYYQQEVLAFKHPDGRVDPGGRTEAALSARQARPAPEPRPAPNPSPIPSGGSGGLRTSVRRVYLQFTEPLEGLLNFMYLDVKGLLTTGLGNLIDATGLGQDEPPHPPTEAERAPSHAEAERYPWKKADGTLASPAEIDAEWDRIRSRLDRTSSGGCAGYKTLATLHVDEADIVRLMIEPKLAWNAQALKGKTFRAADGTTQAPFADFDSWPADAQLALMSMAWGLGVNGFGKYKHFRAASRKTRTIGRGRRMSATCWAAERS